MDLRIASAIRKYLGLLRSRIATIPLDLSWLIIQLQGI